MSKPIVWRGTSFQDLVDKTLFTPDARREAGHQLHQVQEGMDPDHWKPFPEVGPGAKEIIIDRQDGWYRVMYVAKFPEAVYVLHCFKKKTNATSKKDKHVATQRYKDLIANRSN
jgi:phage-related protein